MIAVRELENLRKLLFITLALALVIGALSSLLLFQPAFVASNGMPGMMSGMMGESMIRMPLLWPSILAISVVVAFVVLSYLIAFPPIKYSENVALPAASPMPNHQFDPLDILTRVSKPEERAVLDVLRNSGGSCLQKDIVFKTGLTKLKVHRIIVRLSEREIVQVKKMGKTNEVRVPGWLMQNHSDTSQP